MRGHYGEVFAVASGRLSGREVAVSAGRDGNLCLWNIASGDGDRAVIGAHEAPAIGVALGRAGELDILASASTDGTVGVWHADGHALHVLAGHAGSVVSVAIASLPDGDVIVSSGDDRTVRVWNAVSGKALGDPMIGHIGPVSAVAVGRAGPADVIVSGSQDGTVRVWDATTREALGEPLRGHVDAVRAVAIGGAPGREVIVSGGTDGTIRIWDAASRQAIGEPLRKGAGDADNRPPPVVAVAVARVDDGVAVIGADIHGGLQAWDAATRVPYAEPHGGPGAAILALAVGTVDDAPVVVAGDQEGTLGIWNLRADTDDAGDRVEWVLDAPSTTDELGRASLVRALALRLDRLRRGSPATSFLVHIDGRWGSGKSSLLELLGEDLQRDWLVVRFDAWRQMRVGPPWWALLTGLRRALSDDRRGLGRLRLRLAEAWRRAPRVYALAWCALLAVVSAGLVGLAPTIDLAAANEVAASLTVVAAALGVLYGAAAAVARFVLWESAAGAHRFEQAHRNPMDSLAEHFSWLIGRAGRPVVFFIDDLDRCTTAYVVDLLDSIQTLVRVSSSRGQSAPYFVVAADGRWLRESYEEAHASCGGAVGEPGRPLGYLFLDKIFQVSVDVPSMTSYRRDAYLNWLLGQPAGLAPDINKQETRLQGSMSEAAILRSVAAAPAPVRAHLTGLAIQKLAEPEIEHATEHALRRFAPLLEPNPRVMKRFINAYWIARALQLVDDSYLPRDQLALWTILRVRFPALTDCLREQPEAIAAFIGGRAAPAEVPEHLAPLFGAPEVMRIVHYPAGQPLDANALHACCGHSPEASDDGRSGTRFT
ncbi:MAG: P-loop NTPase fold protein [Actinomycetota bacterium]|nr:P-loop NTPase fold protein [Actinomycetota bacterium]